MTIISSQHYIDWEIVEKKMEDLAHVDRVVIPCSYVSILDGTEYAMQNDAHHTLAAARELGITINFVVEDDCDGLTGEELLDARYMDGDWYDVEKSNPAYDKIVTVW